MTLAIFLSYASQDAEAARRICEALRTAGLEVWFDQSELRGGDAWDASIRKQIKECALFVPIISANTNAREEGYFRLEWKLAVDRSHLMADNKAFFFPVILGGVAEPAALVPDKFRERQWSRLNDDATITAFAERVAKLLAGSASPGKNAPQAAPVLVPAASSNSSAKNDPMPSIAVLAFANRSASADDEYFSDGLADELLNVLAKIQGLRVAARTSAFSFKGKSDDVATIGKKLNVATVLEGSVRKSGNRVRISVQLIKVDDGFHLWSESYDRTLDDIFAVQDDIAQAVVTELRAALLGKDAATSGASVAEEIQISTRARSDNPEAQRLILQARFYRQKRRPADIKRSIALSEEAVALDPHYADAHACLADAWQTMSLYGASNATDGNTVLAYSNRARVSAEAALALDTTLASPHVVLSSRARFVDHDRVAGLREAKLAQALAPNDGLVLHALGHQLMEDGQFTESEAVLSRAVQLDPLSIQTRISYAMLANWGGQPQEALRRICEVLAIDESSWIAHTQLSRVLSALGEYAGAVEAFAHSRKLLGEHEAAAFFRAQFASGGWKGYLVAIVNASRYGVSLMQIARAQIELGRIDDAFVTFDAMIDNYDQSSGWLKHEPGLAPVRGDPRFKAVLLRAGFT